MKCGNVAITSYYLHKRRVRIVVIDGVLFEYMYILQTEMLN